MPAASALRDALIERLGKGVDAPFPEKEFDRLARHVFAFQFENNAVFRGYCLGRGVSPETLEAWWQIPPVPTSAFRELPLASLPPVPGRSRVFRTSGTTQGAERRGVHEVGDVALYDASLESSFEAFLLPDGAFLPLLALLPRSVELPDSSLAYMIDRVVRRFGAAGSGHFVSADGVLEEAKLEYALDAAIADRVPVALLGTSLNFAHWLYRLKQRGRRFALPPGSRLMDTGGYKGSRRDVPETELRAEYAERLGIPPSHCVNEYGLTELCSQYYDTSLRSRCRGEKPDELRHKEGPPWLRARIVDPRTLDALPAGQIGILQHYDLGNLGSVLAVQTEDLAFAVDGGFVLRGRAPGAPPRGCSIAMDELLRAAARRTHR